MSCNTLRKCYQDVNVLTCAFWLATCVCPNILIFPLSVYVISWILCLGLASSILRLSLCLLVCLVLFVWLHMYCSFVSCLILMPSSVLLSLHCFICFHMPIHMFSCLLLSMSVDRSEE